RPPGGAAGDDRVGGPGRLALARRGRPAAGGVRAGRAPRAGDVLVGPRDAGPDRGRDERADGRPDAVPLPGAAGRGTGGIPSAGPRGSPGMRRTSSATLPRRTTGGSTSRTGSAR